MGTTHLLVACDASIDCSIDDAIQAHAEQVDVAMHLLVLVLTNQGPQLLVLVLYNLDGILQRAHLHLRHTVQCHHRHDDNPSLIRVLGSCFPALVPVDLTPWALSNSLCWFVGTEKCSKQ